MPLQQILANLTTLVLLLVPLVAVAGAGATRERAIPRADCSSSSSCAAAHMIVTRESGAPSGVSAMNVLALGVSTQCARAGVDVDITETPYPAELDPYASSEQAGVGNLTALVRDYAACCPGVPLVLMGYSQGAQVTADFLCGTSEDGFPATEAYYAANVTDNISLAAVVLFGDPSFVKGLSWDRGTANNTSYFPRQDTTSCDPVADKMISYCDYDDIYCDSGDSIEVHASYVERYHTEAIDYVVEALNCTS